MVDKALTDYQDRIPARVYAQLQQRFTTLRPSQWKAIEAGLFTGKNLLVCTPTASGKTLVGELAMLHTILSGAGTAVYVVPLRALAAEKHAQFTNDYPELRVALASGETDGADPQLGAYDVIVTTSEKLDSLLRHRAPWLERVATLVIDEVHLLGDTTRGPTLEVVITLLRRTIRPHIVALSATIGNAAELASWLGAELIEDHWRPVELKKGVYVEGSLRFP